MALSKLTIYNFAFFEGAWLACVLLASPWAILVVFPFVVIQLLWGQQWQRDMRTGVTFVLLGALVESFLLGTGSMSIQNTVGDIPPLWLLCMWFCFGISTHYSLAWLRTFKSYKVLWQVAVAGVLAPIAYYGAEKLGAVTINEGGLLAVGVAWGVITPICLLMTDKRADPDEAAQ